MEVGKQNSSIQNVDFLAKTLTLYKEKSDEGKANG